MTRHFIGTTEQFTVGATKLIQINSRNIGIYRLSDNRFHALLNYCPHQGAELCKGPVTSWISSSSPGEFQYDKEGKSYAALGTVGSLTSKPVVWSWIVKCGQ